MPRHAKTFIWVNRHNVKHNEKTGDRKPVLTIEQRGERRYGHSVKIDGPSELVYRPDNPRSCGARVWLETYADVKLDEKPAGSRKCAVRRRACPL